MSSHNYKTDRPKEEAVVIPETVSIEKPVRITNSQLIGATELSISDDVDTGNDPYNSTGHHVVIRSGLDIDE